MSTTDGHSDGGTDPLVGQVLQERYRVVRKLEQRTGAGLYAAQHLYAERAVAVEVIDARAAAQDAVDRFLEDARTVARVGHENAVEIINGGRLPDGAPFLAMEALEGITLARTLAKDGPLLWDRAQGIVLQLAAALGAVHRHGVVHGDVCPENVVVVPRGGRRDFVKLLDFGVARVRSSAPAPAPSPGARESVDDPRDDVQALGWLTYELVTGRPPFTSELADPAQAAADLAGQRATETPAAPSTLRPAGSLPGDLDGVVLRALEKDPNARWPDMAAFADAISRCRLTRRQSVRVEALASAELAGKTGAFEQDARRRGRAWSVGSVAVAVVIATAVLRYLSTSPGHVQISTVPADADLTFNGLPVQARSPVVLDAAPGRYTLVVSRAGYMKAERAVDVAARATVNVLVELVALPAPAPNPATAATAAPPPAAEVAAPAAAAPAP